VPDVAIFCASAVSSLDCSVSHSNRFCAWEDHSAVASDGPLTVDDLDPALHARALFSQHELAAGEVDAGLGQQDLKAAVFRSPPWSFSLIQPVWVIG
jgi:hypothetical protein